MDNSIFEERIKELIERDTPKKPLIIKDRYGENYFCVNCDNDVSYTYSFCSACGQRILWDD